MDVYPSSEKPGKLDVTFLDEDERIAFGMAAPFFTREYHRGASNYYNHGQSMLPYDSEWPQTATFSRSVVASVAGTLIGEEIRNPGSNPARAAMLEDITNSAAMQPDPAPAEGLAEQA